MPGLGDFEILEGDKVKATGTIQVVDDGPALMELEPAEEDDSMIEMKSADVYKDLRLRGYEYGPTFQGIQTADAYGKSHTNWITGTGYF